MKRIALSLKDSDTIFIFTEHPIAIMMMNESLNTELNTELNTDEALFWINESLKSANLTQFTDLRCRVFRGCWNRDTYQTIAIQNHRDHDYIREVGAELLQQLSVLLRERVTKQNLRTIVHKVRSEVVVATVEQQVVEQQVSEPIEDVLSDSFGQGLGDRKLSTDQDLMNYDPTFLGRDEDVAAIDRKWCQERSSAILIHGAGGMGKTRLARKFFEQKQFSLVLECWIPPESARSPSAEQQVETWLKQHFNEEVGRDFHSNLDRLRHCLRQRLEQIQSPIGVLLDNFDALLDGRGRFRPDGRSYLDLLRMLADHGPQNGPQTLTLITSREVIQESLVNLTLHSLKGLSAEAWKRAFSSHDIVVLPQVLQEMWDACQGNATAMKILRGEVRDRYEGDLEAYWKNCDRNVLNDDQLQELVASQFEKLRQQYKHAYNLLCRLGCYRYEMPSHITISGVNALLWDVPESEQRSVVRSLQNLALVESRRGDIFWLHPMIHAEARQRLRHTSDWTVAHGRAIGFWLELPNRIEKVEQTRPFLEAYYHALDMHDYDKACEILVQPVSSLWGDQLSFGWVLYRFRSLQQIIETAEPILNKVDADLNLGRLCNLLGYTYRATGDLDRALIHHQKARSIAEDQCLKHLRISSLLNLALCHRDRWDVAAAIAEFKTVYDLSVDDSSTGYQRYAACCLAYLYSGWGEKAVALDYMHAINTYELIPTGSSWGQAYSLLYLGHAYRNLGEYEAALELFQEVLIVAKASDFIPIYAMALSASAQIYREFGQRSEAIDRHNQAIELLDTLGAKCDLAGAYAQRGLTYLAMGDEKKAWQDKGMAIGLFRAINVPKQVEWVREAFRQTLCG